MEKPVYSMVYVTLSGVTQKLSLPAHSPHCPFFY